MILRGNMFSKLLEMETGITVVAPSKMHEGNYKVAYLLHGRCGRSGDLVDYTMLPVYANEYDIVFIMPEVARSFYTDMQYGLKYFSYVTEELPQICKNMFNISSNREDTMVLGISMGGYGALKCALSKPEQYSFCFASAPVCLYLKEFLDFLRSSNNIEEIKKIYGEELINDFFYAFGSDVKWTPEDEILELAKRLDQKDIKPSIYTTCGTKDEFREFNLRFKEDMEKLNFDFAYEEWEGQHDWYFFNESLQKALEKISR
ncbi:alpha/beta hydrolase [Anaerosacchariphilus polymeriproducens]|uniref:Acetylesterase n=1 Tax=Anaerosacchariphilus polymeriproducens TaxID=1812858 RepID=A0A371AX41_9FIRM|nr:alpha/beta hydrolase family protein [Anaerosacchariphilus polymeriproducens]RDU24148.1 acetylesterase [Anaerosacchariphilus polymeriproducens]